MLLMSLLQNTRIIIVNRCSPHRITTSMAIGMINNKLSAIGDDLDINTVLLYGILKQTIKLSFNKRIYSQESS